MNIDIFDIFTNQIFGLLPTGTKLPIHSVVLEINRSLDRVESGICTIDHVSENGDISIVLKK